MDSLSLYYKVVKGDLSVNLEEHEYGKVDRISPQKAADILREWAVLIENLDSDGTFDTVK